MSRMVLMAWFMALPPREKHNPALYFRQHEFAAQSLRNRPRQKPGQPRAADAVAVPRARGAGLPGALFGGPWRAALHLERDLRALPPPGLGAGPAGHRYRRHGGRD